MNKKVLLLLFLLLIIYRQSSNGQTTNISGVINIYTPVTFLGCDYVTVSSASGFNPGDRVLLIQMQGATIDTTNTVSFGTILNYNDAGNYEFATISYVSGSTINFVKKIIKTYTVNGLIQLIRVPHYTSANITSTLTADPWNGQTGGVLAFEASDTVILNANIDVQGLGFRGGALSNGLANCGSPNYFYPISSGEGARKGEGIRQSDPVHEAGRGALANGGGGGNRHNGGGGGGGNYAQGGQGGDQWTQCTTLPYGGQGGNSLIYSNTINKIFLGGGAGCGHENDNVGTPGANGSGIVIIKANTLLGNNHIIYANGADNFLSADIDAAGGGGAGGTVLLEIFNSIQALKIYAYGGLGGDVFSPSGNNCWGPGGGGSGGVLWCTSTTGIMSSLYGGMEGTFYSSTSWNLSHYGAQPGQNGGTITGLILQESNVPCSSQLVVSFQSSDSSICIEGGQCIDFFDQSAGSPTSWLWHFPGAIPDTSTQQNPTGICYTNPGSYVVTLIVSNANGSDTLTVSPMITVGSTPPPFNVIVSGNILTSGSSGSAYQWYLNGLPIAGATDSFYVATMPGNYSVMITDGFGCTRLSGGVFATVNERGGDGGIRVYPNPAKEELWVVSYGLWVGETTFEISNVLGENVYRSKPKTHNPQPTTRIDVAGFAKGVYIVEVYNGEKIFRAKFVKE